jgi:2-aminoadipate transaminase
VNSAADLYDFTEPFKAPQGSAIRELFKYLGRPGMISFAGGYPSKDLFDRAGIGQALEDAYSSDPVACLQYGDTAGSPALRRAILRLMNDRGVTRDVDDVIVTTGSQQGLDLLIKILVAPGDAVLIEEPAYPAAIQALRLAGARLIPVRTDAQGIDIDALTAQLETLDQATRPSRTRPARRCRRRVVKRSHGSRCGSVSCWSKTTHTASCASQASR